MIHAFPSPAFFTNFSRCVLGLPDDRLCPVVAPLAIDPEQAELLLDLGQSHVNIWSCHDVCLQPETKCPNNFEPAVSALAASMHARLLRGAVQIAEECGELAHQSRFQVASHDGTFNSLTRLANASMESQGQGRSGSSGSGGTW